MPPSTDPLTAALALAASGLAVLPCHVSEDGACSCGRQDCPSPGKHPRTRHGLHDASTDVRTLRGWWARWPGANVALRTGATPSGGVVVVDVDPRHGGEASLARLLRCHGALPETAEAATGGGGRHLYFAHPGVAVANSAGSCLGPGLDVRGDGGYVLAAPSRHASGAGYRWRSDRAPVELPAWLLRLLVPPPLEPRRRRTPVVRAPGWAGAALAAESGDVAGAADGERNSTLNRAAFSLGQLVGSGDLTEDEVVDALTGAALAAGLGGAEVASTLASGLRAGRARPRQLRPGTGTP